MSGERGLQAEGIRKVYPTRAEDLVVLRSVSIAADAGESVAIMGPSGSGKSTLLNILGTLEFPTEGQVRLDGEELGRLNEWQLAHVRNRRIGFIFQDHHLLPQCSAIENVLVPTLALGRRAAAAFSAERRLPEDGTVMQRARALLERVGLGDRLDHRPSELSGGVRQRVAIARALIPRPRLLLADEPTGNLDRKSADGIATLLLELQRDEGAILIAVTHSLELARRFSRRLALEDGTLIEQP
ncbi:MAG: ABC transporter ATP-binding protein [Planctomycetes bacterium]|nr:ABC transporter ATP-binding protein [Planctomycetota bacterium]